MDFDRSNAAEGMVHIRNHDTLCIGDMANTSEIWRSLRVWLVSSSTLLDYDGTQW